MTPAEMADRVGIPIAYRLWSQVTVTGDCWEWQGRKTRNGYGQISWGGNQATHRLAYELAKSPIPAGLFVLHSCDRPTCIKPDHLNVGTAKDNAAERDRKSRSGNCPAAINRAKTHCVNGHPLSGANLYVCPEGRRRCRRCRAAAFARFHARHAALAVAS